MKKVSIIIPNWNGQKFLKDCLESIRKITYSNYEIVVVDNGSSDDSVQYLRDVFPEVLVIKNEKNIGFAGACNIGIKDALRRGVDFVLLLNNDTIVTFDFLSKMVEVMEWDQVGIVGSKIYYCDEPRKIWFAGGDFIWWRASGKHRYWMQNDNDNIRGVVDSDFITGCNMLIRKEVFNDVGFFYEPYFLTVEDLDFCYQARKAKWEIKTVLDAKIYHKVSLSRDGEFSFSNGYYGTRNRLHFSFRRTKLYFGGLFILFIVAPIRAIQWTMQGKISMRNGLFQGIFDFLRGRLNKFENKNNR